MKPLIFDIKHFAVHDGDGIRTTVFFKGCPLRCQWCHNPEGLSPAPQLHHNTTLCTACGACAAVCPTHAHTFEENGAHCFDRQRCIACGACAKVCPQSALRLYGTVAEIPAILEEVLADREFYAATGGGVTLSGGECLCHPAFCAELLKECKKEGIHCAVDTSGAVERAALDAVLPYTDLFLFDLKLMDPQKHRLYTGVSNERILANLSYLVERGAVVEIRIPLLPGINEGEIPEMGAYLASLGGIHSVRVLPYHSLATSKYRHLGMAYPMPPTEPPNAEMLADTKQTLRGFGLTVID